VGEHEEGGETYSTCATFPAQNSQRPRLRDYVEPDSPRHGLATSWVNSFPSSINLTEGCAAGLRSPIAKPDFLLPN
jgi:hypothetical protein